MKTQTIQIENTNCEDFKNEIIDGVVAKMQHLAIQFASTNEPDKLLSRNETAKLLSISLVSLWSMTKDNLIPAYHIGKSVRYKQSEVLQALQLKMNKHNSSGDEKR